MRQGRREWRAAVAAGVGAVAVAGVSLAGGSELQTPDPAEGGDCARALVERVQDRYAGVKDLSARFEQRTETVALGSRAAQALVAAGRVVFAKPGRMRWAYDTPEPSLVVSDGESVWIYDPEAKEAQHLPLGRSFLSGAAIQFLLGEGKLLDAFEVEAADCKEGEAHLRLIPRSDAPYERIGVQVEPSTGEVRETVVTDLLGNVTRVRLLEPHTNTAPGEEMFRFVPPEGVRVLEVPTQ